MAEENNVFNTTLLICTLDFQHQTDEAFKVDGRKHTHTHTPAVDNNILDNPLSNDELNSSIIRESQTPLSIRKPLETPAQKTFPSRRKSSSITEIVNYISKKYDELALSHLKQQMLSEIREIIKYENDNAPD